ncbi:MAG TPA: hypothetical protein VKB09_02470 [Thermomicrobiales bacterium]|nr:hypothetical protein [Thermomicrobiales bacterium]
MRALIISRQKFPAPQAEFPAIMQAFVAWRERYKPVMEQFEFFASGNGGCGIVDVPADQTLARIFVEYPWGPYSENEIHPILDGDTALGMWKEMIAQMTGSQG